jgi:hypothetical protein
MSGGLLWPVKFAIFDGDTVLGKFEVELQFDSTFSAMEIM